MKRKGFTLVELLIVIVVIGILATMMMLSSTEAVTSSKASNVVSNLRNLKTAALSFYADHQDAFSLNPNTAISGTTSKDAIFGYLGNGKTIPESDDYSFNNNNGQWFVYYKVNSDHNPDAERTKIFDKLKGRAKSLGLLYSSTETGDPSSQKLESATARQNFVVLQIR